MTKGRNLPWLPLIFIFYPSFLLDIKTLTAMLIVKISEPANSKITTKGVLYISVSQLAMWKVQLLQHHNIFILLRNGDSRIYLRYRQMIPILLNASIA